MGSAQKKGCFLWESFSYQSVDQAWVDKALVQDVAKLDEDSCHAVIVGKNIKFSNKIKLRSGNTPQIHLDL